MAPMVARRAVESIKEVLDAFSDAHKQLQTVQRHRTEMQKDVEVLTKRVSSARIHASTVMSQTSQVRANCQTPSDHAAALQSDQVDAMFLEALHKLERIDQDSIFSFARAIRGLAWKRWSLRPQRKKKRKKRNEQEAVLLREAIRAHRARLMLLRYFAEEGGHGGIPWPMEMHAHDPMRHTNDIFPCMHQTLAS
ncbi:Conserved oligomeric Golgi complex subunit 6 [Gracilaria domingensis]|nr:Conserved oligomeric Golgi complex subunit 6 [Gracilaria domingensis]